MPKRDISPAVKATEAETNRKRLRTIRKRFFTERKAAREGRYGHDLVETALATAREYAADSRKSIGGDPSEVVSLNRVVNRFELEARCWARCSRRHHADWKRIVELREQFFEERHQARQSQYDIVLVERALGTADHYVHQYVLATGQSTIWATRRITWLLESEVWAWYRWNPREKERVMQEAVHRLGRPESGQNLWTWQQVRKKARTLLKAARHIGRPQR